MPALFPAADAFDECDSKGVLENEPGSSKIDTVLSLVDPLLLLLALCGRGMVNLVEMRIGSARNPQ